MKPHAAHKRTRKPHAEARREAEQRRDAKRVTAEEQGVIASRTVDAGERLYGVMPVLEALRAGHRSVEHIVIAEGAHTHRLRDLLDLARKANVPVRRAGRAEFTRVVGEGVNHQGVMGVVAAARYRDADDLLDALAARAGTSDPALAVVLDGVEDPRNLGAILRTVECAGAHGVFIPERRAVGLTETVAKAAAGALEHVAVARAVNLSRLIDEFKQRGIWTVGTSGEAGMEYTAWDYTLPTALFFGGEGTGLHRLVRERCDVLVKIPMRGHTESLNVSVAAGIVLYEALRQRGSARTKATTMKDEREIAQIESFN
ncbi:MAG: 23S rRNA (guanosine(2251)-2'-O)-methyltransferase RlmB [Acidobacteria bacterium]|nr:23S rRNA (guanosine(2251)-2'-O)-methyltransferase RlmB [Acidobacteriota bacterium]